MGPEGTWCQSFPGWEVQLTRAKLLNKDDPTSSLCSHQGQSLPFSQKMLNDIQVVIQAPRNHFHICTHPQDGARMETVDPKPLSQSVKLEGGREFLERSYFEIGTQIYCLHCLREACSFLGIYCPWCEFPGSCSGGRCEVDP